MASVALPAISSYTALPRILVGGRFNSTSGPVGGGSLVRRSLPYLCSARKLKTFRAESPDVRKREREPMLPPYNVLITGSTKGIGYALAREFLKAGDNVLICSRSVILHVLYVAFLLDLSNETEVVILVICWYSAAERVESVLRDLRKEFGERVWGTVCDVREGKDVKALVSFAHETLGYIDIWLTSIAHLVVPLETASAFCCSKYPSKPEKKLQINNAGSNAYSYKPLAETSDDDLLEVVTTNTLGLMICCREAINMMFDQPRGGHIFNIDGAGSDGRPTPRFAAYGATKRSVVHLTKSLQAELQMHEVKNVMVHNLSVVSEMVDISILHLFDMEPILQPGMVTTDLLMSGAITKQAKFFINILAEPPEVVAEYLVSSIRSIPGSQSMKPTYIRFLTGFKAYSQIFSVKKSVIIEDLLSALGETDTLLKIDRSGHFAGALVVPLVSVMKEKPTGFCMVYAAECTNLV
ncbi:hypothetical protein ZIOFF_069605 [Zingiber officinale]|uniref:Chlorophyll(Ide) b reductase NOL, chloroplastic n=1 Tax=Zingiber officinale TaxID=94328 RepID=A0A8J5ERU8_ZINOF|nr:hypothetical protein ZIOFF_069605 [Zingiber officinale]